MGTRTNSQGNNPVTQVAAPIRQPSLRRRMVYASAWAFPVGAAHFAYFLYLAERAAGASAATAGQGIARATLITATMVAAIAFAGTAIIALLGMDRRLDRRSFIGALIAALVLSGIPLVFVLNEAFYMNPEEAYFDPETGALHLVEIFNLAYPWIFLVSFPAAIVILAALILDKRLK